MMIKIIVFVYSVSTFQVLPSGVGSWPYLLERLAKYKRSSLLYLVVINEENKLDRINSTATFYKQYNHDLRIFLIS